MKTRLKPDNTPASIEKSCDLGQLDDDIGYLLRRAQLAAFADFNRTFADIDIRPAQYAVMMVLHQTPGLRQSQVADSLGIKRANFVTLFDGLIERGFVARLPVMEDRRAVSLHLTPAGQSFISKLQQRADAHARRLTEKLGDSGRTRLIELLQRLTEL